MSCTHDVCILISCNFDWVLHKFANWPKAKTQSRPKESLAIFSVCWPGIDSRLTLKSSSCNAYCQPQAPSSLIWLQPSKMLRIFASFLCYLLELGRGWGALFSSRASASGEKQSQSSCSSSTNIGRIFPCCRGSFVLLAKLEFLIKISVAAAGPGWLDLRRIRFEQGARPWHRA